MKTLEISRAEHDAYVYGTGWIRIDRSPTGLEWERVAPVSVVLLAADTTTPAEPTLSAERWSPQRQALHSIWRDVAEKGIEAGVDWPRVVLSLFESIDDLRSRLACVAEATTWDRPYDTRIAAIRGMCDLTTDGMTPIGGSDD